MKSKIGQTILITFGFSIGIVSIMMMLALGNGMTTYLTKTMEEFVNPNVIEIYKPTDSTSSSDQKNENTSQEPLL